MQITLRIDDKLYRKVKTAAARQGVTITSYIEEAVKLQLRSGVGSHKGGKGVTLPAFSGGAFVYSPAELKALAAKSESAADRRKVSLKKQRIGKQRKLLDLYGTGGVRKDYDHKQARTDS
jgi:hypothetical protein